VRPDLGQQRDNTLIHPRLSHTTNVANLSAET
jgi:hypothetical protein